MIDNEIRPDFTHKGREYYNRTNAARYVDLTDTGFRRKIKKIEAENGFRIPMISRGGQQKLMDRRILDQFHKPAPVGKEKEWLAELKNICQQINSEE